MLDGIEHGHRMTLHHAQEVQLLMLIEEHAAHNLGEDGLGGARDTCII